MQDNGQRQKNKKICRWEDFSFDHFSKIILADSGRGWGFWIGRLLISPVLVLFLVVLENIENGVAVQIGNLYSHSFIESNEQNFLNNIWTLFLLGGRLRLRGLGLFDKIQKGRELGVFRANAMQNDRIFHTN